MSAVKCLLAALGMLGGPKRQHRSLDTRADRLAALLREGGREHEAASVMHHVDLLLIQPKVLHGPPDENGPIGGRTVCERYSLLEEESAALQQLLECLHLPLGKVEKILDGLGGDVDRNVVLYAVRDGSREREDRPIDPIYWYVEGEEIGAVRPGLLVAA